jgi:hypothetical protein
MGPDAVVASMTVGWDSRTDSVASAEEGETLPFPPPASRLDEWHLVTMNDRHCRILIEARRRKRYRWWMTKVVVDAVAVLAKEEVEETSRDLRPELARKRDSCCLFWIHHCEGGETTVPSPYLGGSTGSDSRRNESMKPCHAVCPVGCYCCCCCYWGSYCRGSSYQCAWERYNDDG